eukprot:TRINITY_DN31521_c0_g1_i1.p1 TRINITY_DN31521_c0_g1~~TRINITY_DN31521_c0_g1_i1.p1  ORF type:complete len:743 (-),score=162.51 TRINITY_DN31521_c0_g1_i1:325-2370(-)
MKNDDRLQKLWGTCKQWRSVQADVKTNQMHRQVLNCEVALRMLEPLGVEWLLHIDADELFHISRDNDDAGDDEPQLAAATTGASTPVARHFARVPRSVLYLAYLNHEAIPEQIGDFEDYFREVTLFRRNPMTIAGAYTPNEGLMDFPRLRAAAAAVEGGSRDPLLLRMSAMHYWQERTEKQLGSPAYFLAYGNGKAAVRVGAELLPNGVHRWGRQESWYCPAAHILHFCNVGEAGYLAKYAELLSSSTLEGSFDMAMCKKSLDLLRKSDYAGARALYRNVVYLDDEAEVERQLAAGICFRAQPVLAVCGGAAGSGVKASSITAPAPGLAEIAVDAADGLPCGWSVAAHAEAALRRAGNEGRAAPEAAQDAADAAAMAAMALGRPPEEIGRAAKAAVEKAGCGGRREIAVKAASKAIHARVTPFVTWAAEKTWRPARTPADDADNDCPGRTALQMHPGFPNLLSNYVPALGYHEINLRYPGLQLIHEDPALFLVNDFLSNEECERLRGKAQGHLQPSHVTGAPASVRTSYVAYMAQREAPSIVAKVIRLLNCEPNNISYLNIVRYQKGQFFRPHVDGVEGPSDMNGFRHSARLATIFVYLNDVEQGGETNFLDCKLSIKPTRGTAVVHFPVRTDFKCDFRTYHESATAESEKWILATWLHSGVRRDPAYLEEHMEGLTEEII